MPGHITMKIKLGINRKRSYINAWKLNNIFLNDQWITEKKQGGEIKRIESNKNKSTNSQNIQAAAKAILRKFIAIKIR